MLKITIFVNVVHSYGSFVKPKTLRKNTIF